MWTRRTFLTLAAGARTLGASECSPLIAWGGGSLDRNRVAGALGAGRLEVEFKDAILHGEGDCLTHSLDFVRLRIGPTPAFAASRIGPWRWEGGGEASLTKARPLRLAVYVRDLDTPEKIEALLGWASNMPELSGVCRFQSVTQEGDVERLYRDQPATTPHKASAAPPGPAESRLGVALTGRIAESRAWNEFIWETVAPHVAIVDGDRLGLADADILHTAGGPAERGVLRGVRGADRWWRTESEDSFAPLEEGRSRLAQAVGRLPLAEVPASEIIEAAVFRGFRSPAGDCWLETRFLHVRRRDDRLELFPAVDEFSLGGPVVVRDGIAGLVIGLTDAARAEERIRP